MENGKLITFNKTGRLKLLTLTKKGEQIAELIEKIRSTI
jgi:predicted transcriptional regulator